MVGRTKGFELLGVWTWQAYQGQVLGRKLIHWIQALVFKSLSVSFLILLNSISRMLRKVADTVLNGIHSTAWDMLSPPFSVSRPHHLFGKCLFCFSDYRVWWFYMKSHLPVLNLRCYHDGAIMDQIISTDTFHDTFLC